MSIRITIAALALLALTAPAVAASDFSKRVVGFANFGRAVAASDACPNIKLRKAGGIEDLSAAAISNAEYLQAVKSGAEMFLRDYANKGSAACEEIANEFPKILEKGK